MGPRIGAADGCAFAKITGDAAGFQYVTGSLNGVSSAVDDRQEFGSAPWSVAVIDDGSYSDRR